MSVIIYEMGLSGDENVNYEMQWGDWTGSQRALLAPLGTNGMRAHVIGTGDCLADLTWGMKFSLVLN